MAIDLPVSFVICKVGCGMLWCIKFAGFSLSFSTDNLAAALPARSTCPQHPAVFSERRDCNGAGAAMELNCLKKASGGISSDFSVSRLQKSVGPDAV